MCVCVCEREREGEGLRMGNKRIRCYTSCFKREKGRGKREDGRGKRKEGWINMLSSEMRS